MVEGKYVVMKVSKTRDHKILPKENGININLSLVCFLVNN